MIDCSREENVKFLAIRCNLIILIKQDMFHNLCFTNFSNALSKYFVITYTRVSLCENLVIPEGKNTFRPLDFPENYWISQFNIISILSNKYIRLMSYLGRKSSAFVYEAIQNFCLLLFLAIYSIRLLNRTKLTVINQNVKSICYKL